MLDVGGVRGPVVDIRLPGIWQLPTGVKEDPGCQPLLDIAVSEWLSGGTIDLTEASTSPPLSRSRPSPSTQHS